ncbi:hypothetical protein VNO80_01406 [Phaseolus coccineus]|uniref:Uncharacterized protein n=1 Tax=Phaseolus coccineus TaxID=3886 RepID=A0AAN9RSS2_PHACN
MFVNLLDAVQFHCFHEGLLLCEKVSHEIGEVEPGLAISVIVGLEEDGVVLERNYLDAYQSEEGVAVENGDAVGLGLTFFLELFGGFGYEEGGEEWGYVRDRFRV